MSCTACGTANRPGRRFCSRCGATLARACGACGFVNEPSDEFCGGCGRRLMPAASELASKPAPSGPGAPETPLDAERRQITVMFCDLVGSTALAGRLDPEELREHVRAYQTTSAEVIARFEGHIAQYLGDGLLVYFGYPTAHEDDAQRAVRSALGIVDAVAEHNARQAQSDVSLAVRVGIHTGLVVVGEVGGGSRREQLALGETPNVASRLEALAAPGTVVVSAATHRLVAQRFACRDLGLHHLRGVAASQPVYQVMGEQAASGHGIGLPVAWATPLVGREREVALVLERWDAVVEGIGQVVLLSGEAGIGKTRITQTVCERLQNVRHTRLDGRCSPYRQHSPMHVVVELLQSTLGFERDDTPEMLTRRLERTVSEIGLPPTEAVPLLALLLGLPTSSDSPVLAWAPERQRQRTIEVVLDVLRGLAEPQPLLVLVEDLHWIDASSLELLSVLVDQVATVAICVLLTARPDFRPPWAARSHTTQITLTRLPRRQTEQMVLSVAGNKPLPAEVLQRVVNGADGVPLFVEELTKMVLESGLLRDRDDHYELTAPLRPLTIPATLRDSLTARLDRLSEAKPVAQLAAAIGREFSYELLQAISPLDPPALQRELARLVAAELLYQRGLPPAASYIFKHALIQEAAYQSLLRATRQQYHRRIVTVLAERFPQIGELNPELVAHHYSEANLAADAIPYWRRAGENAVRRSAYREATAHFERGLELVSTLPDSPLRDRQELGLLMGLGPVLFATRGFAAPEVDSHYARARQLCDHLGDAPEVFPTLWGQWGVLILRGNVDEALEIGEQLLAFARSSADTALLLQARHALWPTHMYRGELPAALQDVTEGLSLYDLDRHRSLAVTFGGHDARVCGLAFNTLTLALLGRFREALASGRHALGSARALAHPHSQANGHVWVSLAYVVIGDTDLASAAADAALAISAEHGFPQWAAGATLVRGATLATSGDIDLGLIEMRRGLASWQATGAGVMIPMFLLLIAAAEMARGDAAAALGLIEDASRRIEVHGERMYEAEVHRLRGEALLASARPDPVLAEACFRRAVSVAGAQQARCLELRATISLARLWQRQGRRDDAHRLLAESARWFSEDIETSGVRDARRLLHDLA
jgi:class 3 adenylate cyclase/predicted ATPase